MLKIGWKSILVVALAGASFAAWRYENKSYEGPPKTSDPIDFAARDSSITIPFSASLDDIQAKLNEAVPSRLYAIDENRDGCVPAKWIDECILRNPINGHCIQNIKTKITPDIDCHVDGAVDRGAITIGGDGDTLTVTMPIAAQVTVRGRGEIGKNVQATATGAITATATIKAGADENWNPTADVNADYSWNNRIGVDVLGFRITFASKVDPKIKEAIDGFKAKLPELLAKLDLKGKAEKVWAKGFTVVQVREDPPVWIRFSPSAVGFSGYAVHGRQLVFAAMAKGKTETFVGKKPADPQVLPLPPLKHDLPAGGFDFLVPISADYPSMTELAKKALKVGSKQEFDIKDVGKVDVTFEGIAIHQTSGHRLAVGVTLDAKGGSDLLDTKGTIWLTAAVRVDNQAKKITFDKLDVYSNTDNAPVDLLAAIMRSDTANKKVRDALAFDFSKQLDTTLEKGNAALRRQLTEDIYLQGRFQDVAADRVEAGPDALVVVLEAKGVAEMGLGKLP